MLITSHSSFPGVLITWVRESWRFPSLLGGQCRQLLGSSERLFLFFLFLLPRSCFPHTRPSPRCTSIVWFPASPSKEWPLPGLHEFCFINPLIVDFNTQLVILNKRCLLTSPPQMRLLLQVLVPPALPSSPPPPHATSGVCFDGTVLFLLLHQTTLPSMLLLWHVLLPIP